MSREMLQLAEALASEKNVESEVVFEALEFALSVAAKKKADREHMDVRVSIDRNTGEYHTFRRWLIVADEDYTYPDTQKTIEEIQEEFPDSPLQIGEYYEEELENVAFGRQAAQTAKQIILQRIRDAEREQILQEFLARREDVVMGTVKRVERHGIIVEIGRLDALIPRDQCIPRENFRSGDRIRALFLRVDEQGNSGRKQVILSRTSREFLVKLFEQEVPEIEDGLLEIKEAARDPGQRAKIAVKSNDARIDPQGTCIGVRGSRVNAVSNELAGERVDVVLWSPETAQFVINALSPAEVSRILIDEDNHSVDVIVAEDQLAPAIGRGGQNVRLAADLTGWQLNIMTVQEAEERHEAEDAQIRSLFMQHLNVDEQTADLLIEEGFAALEEVAYVPGGNRLRRGHRGNPAQPRSRRHPYSGHHVGRKTGRSGRRAENPQRHRPRHAARFSASRHHHPRQPGRAFHRRIDRNHRRERRRSQNRYFGRPRTLVCRNTGIRRPETYE